MLFHNKDVKDQNIKKNRKRERKREKRKREKEREVDRQKKCKKAKVQTLSFI